MEIIGWLGSILLAFCGLPQAIESYKTKSSEGLTWGFLFMWFVGEILTIIYILPQMVLPLIFNYTANIIFLSIIIYYKINPKE
jgi:MtN3 and saliva related transmembrane protein